MIVDKNGCVKREFGIEVGVMVVGAGCLVWIPAFAGMTVGVVGCVNMMWQSLGDKIKLTYGGM